MLIPVYNQPVVGRYDTMMMASASSVRLLLLALLPLALAAAAPQQAVWSSGSFGPDGPWNAVSVSIGGQPKISLFPGRMFHTYVTTSDYCAFNNSVPHCASGTYLKDNAVAGSSSASGSARKIDYKPPTQQLEAGVEARGTANMYLDTVDLGIGSAGIVQNHSIALVESQSQMLAYPGGGLYPIFTGCLNVGSPDTMQVFTGGGSKANVNASLIPWALKAAGTIESSSFGLHYGSASPSAKLSGSLVFGGYDRNRVVGPVLPLDGEEGLWSSVTLQAITLRVINGTSPFPTLTGTTNSTSNLLTQGNTTMPTAGLPVLLDPCSPYLTLPASTCAAIASHLPVTYNASLGLYLWNTTSPLYARTVSSASTLALTFMGATNTQSLTIHVPLPHLNLTLTPPFTASPVPYFPCFTGGIGAYVLGRAFFQDAFLGANFETKRMWLAQAPGPNIPTGVDVVGVKADETGSGLEAGGNEWLASWNGVWSVLGKEEDSGGQSSGSSGGNGTAGAPEGQGGGGGLSMGAVAGIAVGAAIGGMALIAGVWMFFRKRRAAGQQDVQTTPAVSEGLPQYYGEVPVKVPAWGLVEAPSYTSPVEAPAGTERVEAPGTDNGLYEMPADYRRR